MSSRSRLRTALARHAFGIAWTAMFALTIIVLVAWEIVGGSGLALAAAALGLILLGAGVRLGASVVGLPRRPGAAPRRRH